MTDQPAPQPGDDLPGIWTHADFEGGEADAEDGATRQKRAASLRLVAVMTKNGELSPSEVPGLLAELGHAGCVPRSRADEAYWHGREHESYDRWNEICGLYERAERAEARARSAESERDRYRRALQRISDECEPDPDASDTVFLIARAQAVARARAALDGEDTA